MNLQEPVKLFEQAKTYLIFKPAPWIITLIISEVVPGCTLSPFQLAAQNHVGVKLNGEGLFQA